MKKKVDLFNILNYFLLILFTLVCFYPIWHVLIISFSTFKGYFSSVYHLIPNSFTFENYISIYNEKTVIISFFNSIKVTAVGTFFSIMITVFGGYFFSKEYLPGSKKLFKLVLITMYFSGGLVPSYLLISGLKLKDSMWALILPMLVNTFYMIIAKNFFGTLPQSVEESARIDGANDLQILVKIIIPMSMPIIATLVLFYTVDYWNNYILAVFYINDFKKMTIQPIIRTMLNGYKFSQLGGAQGTTFNEHGVNMAAVLVSLIPILVVYPFLQKYFEKGINLGAIKE